MTFPGLSHLTLGEAEALKRATTGAVEAAGGVIAVAGALNDPKSKVSEKASLFHLDRWFNLLRVAELERLAGKPVITRALARLAGHELVPAGRFTLEDPHLHLSRVIAETGEVTALMAQSLADGRISSAEARRLAAEHDQAIEALQASRAQLNAVLAGAV